MNLNQLAQRLVPRLATLLLQTPRVWGDPKRITMAPDVVPNNTLFNTSSGTITLEEDVFFGHNVCLLTGTHDITRRGSARRRAIPQSGRDIVIRKGVWLSSNVTVLGPCEIGENAVIAAGSLVTGNVPANSLFAGTPAKFIKEIEFSD